MNDRQESRGRQVPDVPLVAISTWGVSGGALATVAANLAKGFSERGCGVHIVRVDRAPPSAILGFPVAVKHICLNRRSSTSVLALAGYLRETNPDILITIGTMQNAVGVLAKAISPSTTGVLLLSEQSTLSYKAKVEHRTHPWLRRMVWFARNFYGRADAVVAVSEGVRRDLVAIGVAGTPVVTIPNPVDVPQVVRLAQEVQDTPYPNAGARPRFLAVGRLADQKDHRLLLDAFASVRVQLGAGSLVILGEGPLRSNLEERVGALGLISSVSMPGFVANPFPMMSASDAFVLSSREEGFGLVLVEAMALGLPIVAGNCPGGVAEVLEGGKAGILVPPHDAEALAAGMITALEDVQRRKEVVDQGYRRAEDFRPDSIADQWLELARSVQK